MGAYGKDQPYEDQQQLPTQTPVAQPLTHGTTPAPATMAAPPASGPQAPRPTTATASAPPPPVVGSPPGEDTGFVSDIETMYNTILGQQKKEWQNQKSLLKRQNAVSQARAANSASRMGGGMGSAYQTGMRQSTLNTQGAINQGKAAYMEQRRGTLMNQLADTLREKQTLRGRDWAKSDQDATDARGREDQIFESIMNSGDKKLIAAFQKHLAGGGSVSDFDSGAATAGAQGNWWSGLKQSDFNNATQNGHLFDGEAQNAIAKGTNLAGKGGLLSPDQKNALYAYALNVKQRYGHWPSAGEIRDRINNIMGEG